MNEEKTSGTPGDKHDKEPDLANELRDLGRQLDQSVRAALTSERAQTIRNDISSGMGEIGKQLQAALKSLQSAPQVQNLSERGQQAVNQAQESPAWKDLQETLAGGIAQLNDKLAAFTQRMQAGSGPAATGSASQQVPVEDVSQATPPVTGAGIQGQANEPPPTTGDTTRL